MIQIKQFVFMLILTSFIGYAQKTHTIKGTFPEAKNTILELVGFNTLKDTLIATTKSNATGAFTFLYPAQYKGAAILKLKDSTQQQISFIVLLNKENFSINWTDFKNFDAIRFENSAENDSFYKGMTVYQASQNILAGLNYLQPLYKKMPTESKWLQKETKKQENTLAEMIKKLPSNNYAGYYLTIRKMIADMPVIARTNVERIPEIEKQFKGLNFNDEKLLQSGLLSQLLASYYLLMESYGNLDTVAQHANSASDAILNNLAGNEILKQEIAAHLFKQLEKTSLYKSAEHVALYMLNDGSCTLDKKSTALYEQYRKMGVGNTAPEIQLTTAVKNNSSLSAVSANYKLVVFGSSWCPKCQEEVVQLKKYYQQWKKQYNLEVVFVSIDTDPVKYEAFINDFEWISSCDFKGWKTQAAVDYFVFATPTIYLLDADNKILLKPFSTEQVNSWLIGNGSLK